VLISSPCVQDANVLEWVNAGVLLQEEAEPVVQIQRSLQEAHSRLKNETNALEQELAELTDKGMSATTSSTSSSYLLTCAPWCGDAAATKRNRAIADADLSYGACAEAKLVELYSRNYRDRIANARRERDQKLARVSPTHTHTPHTTHGSVRHSARTLTNVCQCS
jgi:cell division septum initiation protein DivIVA